MKTASPWDGDWEQRLLDALAVQGFEDDVISFVKVNPSLTYPELIDLLDENVAPIQLIYLLTEKAQSSHAVDWFSKDCLVRNIRQICKEGWKSGSKAEFNAAYAVNKWISCMGRFGESSKKMASSTGKEILSSSLLRKGWLPNSYKDEVVQTILSGVSFEDLDSTSA